MRRRVAVKKKSKDVMAAMRERERQAGLVRPQLVGHTDAVEAARQLGTERGTDLQTSLGALIAVGLEALADDQEMRDRFAVALDAIKKARGLSPRNQTEFDLETTTAA